MTLDAPPPPEPKYDDALPEATDVPAGSLRDRIRHKPGIGQAYRAGVFIAGLLCIAAGVALIVLPGPLTIPPILLGLWLWSTEFEFAHRFLEPFQEKGREAWEHTKAHPVSASIVIGGGLIAAVVAIWATMEYELISEAKNLIGL